MRLLRIAGRRTASGPPPGVLFDCDVPYIPSMGAVIPQHCFLGGSRHQTVAAHSNTVSGGTDIARRVKRRSVAGLKAGVLPSILMIHDDTAQAAARERADGLMTGFPPAPEAQVTLANWQDPPYSRGAFRHMRELIPSHPIPAADSAGAAPLPAASGPLPDPPVWRLGGSPATAAEVFADTYTDAVVVLHDGQLVAERYAAGMTAATPHLLMSVSKSLVGCVAGVLAERGLLDPAAPVTAYVPEGGSSGYAGATVRHLLDMRTGIAFRETYTEPDAEVRVMERSMGWRPAQPGDP